MITKKNPGFCSSLFLFLFFLSVLSPVISMAERPAAKAPDWTLTTISGEKIRFSDYKGKVAIVDLWATWCPPCRQEIPDFIKLYEEYKDQGLVIVGISLDQSDGVVKEFVKKMKINYPVVMGNAGIAQAYGNINSIPTTFIIDAEGNIAHKFIGFQPKKVFEDAIKPLLKKVTATSTGK